MRRVATVLGILVLLLVGGILILPRFVSEEMLRARLVEAIEGRLERPVSLDRVGFGFRPVPSVRAEGVTLGRTSEQPQEIRVGSLDLYLALRPLLRREVEVKSLSINGLRADVYLGEEDSTGGASDSDSVESGDSDETASDGSTTDPDAGYAVSIEAFVLRDGEIRVFRGDETVLRLSGLEEDLAATLTPAGGFELSGETRVADWEFHTPTGRFGRQMSGILKKSLRYDPAQDRLDIETAALTLGDLPVSLTGNVQQLAAVPELDLSFDGGPAELSNILGLLPSSLIEQAAGIESAGRVTVNGTVAGAVGPGMEPDFRFSLDLADGTVAGGDLPATIESIVARLIVSPTEINVESLTLRSQDSDLDIRGKILDYQQQPQLDLAIDGNLDLALATALQTEENAPQLAGRAIVQGVIRGELPETTAGTSGARSAGGGSGSAGSGSAGSGSAGSGTSGSSGSAGGESALGLLSGLEALATFELRDVSVDGLEHPIRQMNGKGSLRNQELRVDGLAFRIGESDLRIDGTVNDYRALLPEPGNPIRSRADVTLRSTRLDLDAFQPTEGGTTGGGGSSGASSEEPSGFELFSDLIGRLEGPVRLDIDKARLQQIEWEDVQAQGSVAGGVIDVTGMVTKAFSGTVTLRGDVDLRDSDRPAFDLEVGASQIDAAKFLTSNPGLSRLSGLGGFVQGKMEFRASADGALMDDLSLDIRALTSAGDLQVREGELSGHPAQVALSNYLGQSDFQRLPIQDWLQPFRIRNGRVEFEDLRLQAGGFTLIGSGFTGLDGEMGLRGELQIPEAQAQGLRSKLPAATQSVIFGGESGPVLLPVKVTGPVNKPAVQIDDEKLTARARAQAEAEVEKKKEELKDKARQGIEEKAGGLLDDLLGGTPADSAAADTTETIENEVKGLIKGLFGK